MHRQASRRCGMPWCMNSACPSSGAIPCDADRNGLDATLQQSHRHGPLPDRDLRDAVRLYADRDAPSFSAGSSLAANGRRHRGPRPMSIGGHQVGTVPVTEGESGRQRRRLVRHAKRRFRASGESAGQPGRHRQIRQLCVATSGTGLRWKPSILAVGALNPPWATAMERDAGRPAPAWLTRQPTPWSRVGCQARWLACGDAAAARCRRALRPRWPRLTR
jgi:hypothetical protein